MHWIHLAPGPSLCAPPLHARHHARRCRPVCATSPPPALVGALARIGTGGGGRGDGDTGRAPAQLGRASHRESVCTSVGETVGGGTYKITKQDSRNSNSDKKVG